LKQVTEANLGIKTRCNTLGTTQRAAMHFASKTDADEAYMAGAIAVDYVKAGKSGLMVAIKRDSNNPYKSSMGEAALNEVANATKLLPKAWINAEHNYVTQDFIDYARPLIMGEVTIPMRDGLPDYVYIDFAKGQRL
jgi:6-phosphofructokinase 1